MQDNAVLHCDPGGQVVLDKNCIIGAGALVPEGMVIPDNSVAVGVPARVIFPPKESIIVEKPPFSFASFMVFFIIALIVGARKPPGFRRSINLCSFIPLRGGFWLWS